MASCMNKIILLVTISSFTFLACKKAPVASQATEVIVKPLIDFHPSYLDFVYLTMKTKLEYSDGSNSDQYALSIRAKKDSVIWMSIGKAGVEGVRGLLRPDSVFVMDKLKNDSYSYNVNYLQSLIQSDLSYTNIQNLLVGDLLFPYEKNDAVSKNETHYIVYQKKKSLHVESYVRFDNMKVERVDVVDSAALSKTTVAYSNFITADSLLIPSVCSLDVAYNKNGQTTKRQIVLTHSKIEFPAKPLNFPFSVPKKFNEK